MAKKNVAIEAADMPAGSPSLPKLSDVLAALGLINASELARVTATNSIYPLFAAAPGYDFVRTSRSREVGVSLRYAFGAR